MRGKGSKMGEPYPKFRLSQDRLPILRENVFLANVALRKCHSTVTLYEFTNILRESAQDNTIG